jgi:hypothetical protein
VSHEYIVETSHGDVQYMADTHHTQHQSNQGWWDAHKDKIYETIRNIFTNVASGVIVHAIHEGSGGRRTRKVGDVNNG